MSTCIACGQTAADDAPLGALRLAVYAHPCGITMMRPLMRAIVIATWLKCAKREQIHIRICMVAERSSDPQRFSIVLKWARHAFRTGKPETLPITGQRPARPHLSRRCGHLVGRRSGRLAAAAVAAADPGRHAHDAWRASGPCSLARGRWRQPACRWCGAVLLWRGWRQPASAGEDSGVQP